MKKIKYAAALYPIFNEFTAHPYSVLNELKQMGYDGIEFYGNIGIPAIELKKMLKDVGLENAGSQVSWKYLQKESLEKVIEYHSVLQTKNIIIAALGGPWESGHKISENTVSKWLEHIKYIYELENIFKKYEFQLMYHTHGYDFSEKIENKITSFELMSKELKNIIQFEIDIGSCIEGNKNPIDIFHDLEYNIKSLHCRPYSLQFKEEVLFGDQQDMVPWKQIKTCLEKMPLEWLVIEPECKTLGTPMECMSQGINFVKGL